jgi:hypothetical protein
MIHDGVAGNVLALQRPDNAAGLLGPLSTLAISAKGAMIADLRARIGKSGKPLDGS